MRYVLGKKDKSDPPIQSLVIPHWMVGSLIRRRLFLGRRTLDRHLAPLFDQEGEDVVQHGGLIVDADPISPILPPLSGFRFASRRAFGVGNS